MKKHLFSTIIFSVLGFLLFTVAFTALVWGAAQISPNAGLGERIQTPRGMAYANIAQKFTDDRYFSSRPSAVDYNAAGSGGSNKGPSNPEYLATVQERIDTFLAHNPGTKKADIPSDLVTASGSGLDPHISVQAARVQTARVAQSRGLAVEKVTQLIVQYTEKSIFRLSPERVNVLELNLALDGVETRER